MASADLLLLFVPVKIANTRLTLTCSHKVRQISSKLKKSETLPLSSGNERFLEPVAPDTDPPSPAVSVSHRLTTTHRTKELKKGHKQSEIEAIEQLIAAAAAPPPPRQGGFVTFDCHEVRFPRDRLHRADLRRYTGSEEAVEPTDLLSLFVCQGNKREQQRPAGSGVCLPPRP